MTDIQIQNQNNNLGTNKKEFDHRFDDKPLRILCVKNIPKETTENELLELFKPFGSIENINLKVNKNVGPYAIYAHVYFSSPEEAKRCLKQMNGKILSNYLTITLYIFFFVNIHIYHIYSLVYIVIHTNAHIFNAYIFFTSIISHVLTK